MKLTGTVAVLGTGLLGASFARAVKKYGVAEKVCAWSRGESTRAKCAALPSVFDGVFSAPEDSVRSADIVAVCAPTANIPELVKKIAPALKNGALVTDVGSVKGPICKLSEGYLKDTGAVFVGSHPMAGSEKAGIEHSDADLFKSRPCIVTPSCASQEDAANLLEKIWSAIGMRVYRLSPSEHDAVVARVSHLPHIVAGLLCRCAAKYDGADLRDYAGPGFRDSTRVSSGNPGIWDSIIGDNRDEILKALKIFSGCLSETIRDIESSDSESVGRLLREAKSYRDKLQ